jgi:predicted AlkP superfamily phosphohydrolase/phosphomutase
MFRPHVRKAFIVVFCILLLLLIDRPAYAYIGPGAGFAVLSSFFMILAAFFLALVNLVSWPVRYVWRFLRGKNAYKHAKVKKIVIIGLDGLDHELTTNFMEQGKLPAFSELSRNGRFAPLATTFPSISPVAWSSFQTGVNPGKHNIFDFMSPDWKSYLPQLSSAVIGNVSRSVRFGKYHIPLGKPLLKILRKSMPFWNILGDKGIFTNIIRVPITFPPEKTKGLMLAAMCIPDLRGTQGSFTFYTSRAGHENRTGGTQLPVHRVNGVFTAKMPGPPNPLLREHTAIEIAFSITPDKHENRAVLQISSQRKVLTIGEYSDWIRIVFKAGLGVKINGICRFLLKSLHPELELYVTPIQIDPDKPALPIAYPTVYSTYLAKKLGPFATLGLAEDTWALNERIIDEKEFLQQVWDIHEERERMLFNALDNLDQGVLACVFDSSDRIQHTFMRTLHPDHPANRDRDNVQYQKAIEEMYIRCDRLIARVKEKLGPGALLIVMSDHGFKPFKRGVNVNRWLHDNGYLVLKDKAQGGEWFEGVDWSRTRAYALGLAGIYINRKGREGQGIVTAGETQALDGDIQSQLRGLMDPVRNEVAIKEVFESAKVMKGPYLPSAPDLIVGYAPGYRASWHSVTGTVLEELFTDNTKAWSGDHCIDPRAVPGVFFCSKPVSNEKLSIMDIAPTVLDLFGIQVPSYMDGQVLSVQL